ncbi:MAG: glycolate oxidase subunit GlcE [Rhodospirillales bacterium]|nr:MAG: glycolate oxidase subunit GlcE [Rhodospirillales bacterium]
MAGVVSAEPSHTATLAVETDAQVADAVQAAMAERAPVEVRGGGSKCRFGRPVEAASCLDTGALAGIVSYQPEELVLTARPSTTVAEIVQSLTPHCQMLAFEPPDWIPLLSGCTDVPGNAGGTLGGIVASNLSGPRRIRAGAARDHVLGFRAVSGRGESFKGGGRVVKNVTGFDLPKLLTGSFGTLAVMTEVTVRVLPAGERTQTLLVLDCAEDCAIRAMTAALQSPYDVSGAAHLPPDVAALSRVPAVATAAAGVTAVRIEGPAPSVSSRLQALRATLARFGALAALDDAESDTLWREIRDVTYFVAAGDEPDPRQVWRLSVPPAEGARVVAEILFALPGQAFFDWGGGLIWLALKRTDDAGQAAVRGALASGAGTACGHATLVRADASVRSRVPVFQPQPEPLAALTRRVKAGFDPKGVLNPGRMYEGV